MKRIPVEGAPVTVVFLAVQEPGVIERVEERGRLLTVLTEHGERLAFRLGATGQFVAVDRSARLVL